MSSAIGQVRPSTRWQATATTPIDTNTPTVDSTIAGKTARRMPFHGVVSPPSARMRMSAAYPNTCVSAALSKAIPAPPSPKARPMPR